MNLHKPYLFVSCLLVLAGCVAVKNKSKFSVLTPPTPPEIKNLSKATSNKSRLVNQSTNTNVTVVWNNASPADYPVTFELWHSTNGLAFTNFTMLTNWLMTTSFTKQKLSREFFIVRSKMGTNYSAWNKKQ